MLAGFFPYLKKYIKKTKSFSMKLLSVTTQSCNPVIVPDPSLSRDARRFYFSLFSPTWSLWGWVQLYIKGFTDCWFKIMDFNYFESQNSLGFFISVIIHERLINISSSLFFPFAKVETNSGNLGHVIPFFQIGPAYQITWQKRFGFLPQSKDPLIRKEKYSILRSYSYKMLEMQMSKSFYSRLQHCLKEYCMT